MIANNSVDKLFSSLHLYLVGFVLISKMSETWKGVVVNMMDFLCSNTGLILVTVFLINCILCFLFYINFLKIDQRAKKMLLKFNGPNAIPILGHPLEVLVPNHLIIKLNVDLMAKYGTVIRGWFGKYMYMFVADANVVEKLLSSNVHIEKSQDYLLLDRWLGTGLLTASGAKWHGRRKLLTPTFHFKILEDFVGIFNEQSKILIRILEERAGAGKTPFDIFPYIARCTLDIICESAMGEKLNAQTDNKSAYVSAVYDMGELMLYRFVRPWLRVDWIWAMTYGRKEKKLVDILHNFTSKVIKRRKAEIAAKKRLGAVVEVEEPKSEGKRRLAFLDLLLEASEDGKVLTDLDVREETDTFMFEGHDTTSANISWTIFLLACNQDCQDRLRQELFEVFGEDRNRAITLNDLSKLKYLEYCIKEGLRMYPSVPFFARELQQDMDVGDDKIIPSGTTVFVTTYVLHRDPVVFPDPERFIPERFEPENCLGRNPYAYVPFSAGPRNCIGQKFAMMEEKVVLARIFANFRVEAAERLEDVLVVPDIILRPKNGLHVKFTKL